MTKLHDMDDLAKLAIAVTPVLRAAPDLPELTAGERKDLLRQLRAGEPVELYVDAITYRQSTTPRPLPASRADEANTNRAVFKPSQLAGLAKSFRGALYLADHSGQIASVGGDVVKSELVEAGDWLEFHQTMHMVATWAVESALSGTARYFSIAWRPKTSWRDSCLCSACNQPMSKCSHWPGDVLEDFPGTAEPVLVEILWRDVRGQETSAVAFPAVAGTGIEATRAALAEARRLDHPHPEEDTMDEESKAKLAELGRRLGEVEGELVATKARLAEKDAALTAILAKAKADADVAIAAEMAALKERARAAGKLVPGGPEDKLFATFSPEQAHLWVESAERIVPVGMAPQLGGSAAGTHDKLADFMIGKLGFTALDVDIQRKKNRTLGVSDDQFIASQSKNLVEG